MPDQHAVRITYAGAIARLGIWGAYTTCASSGAGEVATRGAACNG